MEGADGSGKTTNITVLVDTLKACGFDVVTSREPGGTPVGERIRSLILNEEKMSPHCELLLFAAARAEHMATKIIPALAAGKVVVCDRFADSSYAYQGAGRGMKKLVLELEEHVLQKFQPDHTLFFNISLEESTRRLAFRSDESNHFDKELAAFKQKVFQGYQERMVGAPERRVLINAEQPLGAVADEVSVWVREIFAPANQSLVHCKKE